MGTKGVGVVGVKGRGSRVGGGGVKGLGWWGVVG